MKTSYFIIFLLIILAMNLFSCKKKSLAEFSESKDACECLKESRSTFFMGEYFGDEELNLDTVIMPVDFADGNSNNFDYINYTYVTFKANYDNALSYHWQVGGPTNTSTNKEYALYFLDSIENLPVTLIMKSQPNPKCIPNDDGIDTITRYLNIKNKLPHPMWGQYYGYSSENLNHYFTIEIDTLTRYYSYMSPNQQCREVIKNLPEGKTYPFIIGRNSSYGLEGVQDMIPPYTDYFHVEDKDLEFKNSTRAIYYPKTKEIKIIYYTRTKVTPFQLSDEITERIFIGKKL